MSIAESFYFDKQEPVKSCLLALRDMIIHCDAEIVETVKYGMPCFCLGKRAVCYLWIDKASGFPYILFVDGDKLHHPNLVSGSRKRMKVLLIAPEKVIPVQQIQDVLQSMLTLYTS
ncbi:MAG: DUF1801 domain-containing protein [Bacteroidetes bacterium]|jgi:hypothetical protein|nr:DUF1801 domain-containing protein [Bacteroidota bacterium]